LAVSIWFPFITFEGKNLSFRTTGFPLLLGFSGRGVGMEGAFSRWSRVGMQGVVSLALVPAGDGEYDKDAEGLLGSGMDELLGDLFCMSKTGLGGAGFVSSFKKEPSVLAFVFPIIFAPFMLVISFSFFSFGLCNLFVEGVHLAQGGKRLTSSNSSSFCLVIFMHELWYQVWHLGHWYMSPYSGFEQMHVRETGFCSTCSFFPYLGYKFLKTKDAFKLALHKIEFCQQLLKIDLVQI
jgi:hypothetical protein